MKYFSTFSGIGGFEIGIQRAFMRSQRKGKPYETSTRDSERPLEQLPKLGLEGLSCVGYSEIDKYAASVYEYNFPGAKNYGDITKINAEELPDFDLLVGGFPCQAFSIAGKRRGFEDTRGTLFFDLARILRAKQPRLFVFENVKGLLSHDNGNTFKTIIQTLDELGYDLQWQVLNSKNHGVPQNRERIYIVGHLRGTSRPQVFPLRKTNGLHPKATKTEEKVYDVASTQTARQYASWGGNFVAEPSVVAHYGHKNKPAIEKDIVPTLKAQSHGHEPMVKEDLKIRRLTPIECERLQGFPDNWTSMSTNGPVSDTQRYKMCGNAVTTNVVQAVMERLL